MKRLITGAAFLFAAGTTLAQSDDTNLEATEVAPGIYHIVGGGGNFTLQSGDEYNVLYDNGMPPYSDAVVDKVTELAGDSIDFVVNTHVHGDHTGANAAFAGAGSYVVAHENLRKRLVEDPANAGGAEGIPVVTFNDALTFHINGIEAHVFHSATAHTDGDAIIEFRGLNVIYAGDIWFNYVFPYIDLDQGGTVSGFIAAQKKIIALADEDTVILPGHGPAGTRADLQAAVDMLEDAENRVEALVVEGMTADEVVEANPLADYHDTWSWSFISTERMTRTLYRELTE
ncbi:MAG: MBL fold metallo-hydrolase [Woeseiaceae bacterium]|nr:MBL fold metallo-hydrolase [Woeseiaceae bacterium]NIP21077.1 MBL fold metallo-hydrolase [Woeseiaceae bacterium]NIS90049.1 MBL fold metallo-hydrolase [Woeseiaceae bacterium]